MKKIFLLIPAFATLSTLVSCSLIGSDTTGSEDASEIDSSKNTYEIISTYRQAYDKVINSCFGVRNVISATNYTVGSCVCLKTDSEYSYFLTNRHVIEASDNRNQSTSISVYFGEGLYYSATILNCTSYQQRINSTADDLALIRINTPKSKTLVPVTLETGVVSKGMSAISIGCPESLDYYNSVTSGIVSKVMTDQKLIMHTATINPGNSGGGLFSLDGKLIGLNVAGLVSVDSTKDSNGDTYTYNEVDNMDFAINISNIKAFLNNSGFTL